MAKTIALLFTIFCLWGVTQGGRSTFGYAFFAAVGGFATGSLASKNY